MPKVSGLEKIFEFLNQEFQLPELSEFDPDRNDLSICELHGYLTTGVGDLNLLDALQAEIVSFKYLGNPANNVVFLECPNLITALDDMESIKSDYLTPGRLEPSWSKDVCIEFDTPLLKPINYLEELSAIQKQFTDHSAELSLLPHKCYKSPILSTFGNLQRTDLIPELTMTVYRSTQSRTKMLESGLDQSVKATDQSRASIEPIRHSDKRIKTGQEKKDYILGRSLHWRKYTKPRKLRNWYDFKNNARYECRKQFAAKRPRVGGRFVKQT